MKNINNEVFLNKVKQKIYDGDFDDQLNFPFMSRDFLFLTIKAKIDNKIETGATPILSDNEIKICIEDVKESAMNILSMYIKLGFIEKTETGIKYTQAGHIALRAAYTK